MADGFEEISLGDDDLSRDVAEVTYTPPLPMGGKCNDLHIPFF